MSLGVIIKAQEGLVLAAESRVTLTAKNDVDGTVLPIYFDSATKLFSFRRIPKIGVVTWGQSAIGNRPIQTFMPEFERKIGSGKKVSYVSEFAKHLSDFFLELWQKSMQGVENVPPMTFAIGGFNRNALYGKVYLVEIPNKPTPEERNQNDFGYTWGGQHEIVSRITRGYDAGVLQLIGQKFNLDQNGMKELETELMRFHIPVPCDIMPLQECINWAIFLIRTTIVAQSLSIGIQGCGGPI